MTEITKENLHDHIEELNEFFKKSNFPYTKISYVAGVGFVFDLQSVEFVDQDVVDSFVNNLWNQGNRYFYDNILIENSLIAFTIESNQFVIRGHGVYTPEEYREYLELNQQAVIPLETITEEDGEYGEDDGEGGGFGGATESGELEAVTGFTGLCAEYLVTNPAFSLLLGADGAVLDTA